MAQIVCGKCKEVAKIKVNIATFEDLWSEIFPKIKNESTDYATFEPGENPDWDTLVAFQDGARFAYELLTKK